MPVKGGTMPEAQRVKIRERHAVRAQARTHKRCPSCRETKPIEEYTMRRNGGALRVPRSYCVTCDRADSRRRSRAYHQADSVRAAARARRTDLRLRYGLTVEDYDRMLADQGGGCAICHATEPGSRRRYFGVDHDHTTGQVRALLCIACNTGIGHLGDDPARLRAAADYLEWHLRGKRGE